MKNRSDGDISHKVTQQSLNYGPQNWFPLIHEQHPISQKKILILLPQLLLFLWTGVDGTLMWKYNIKLLKASPPQIKTLKLRSFACQK